MLAAAFVLCAFLTVFFRWEPVCVCAIERAIEIGRVGYPVFTSVEEESSVLGWYMYV